MNRRRKKSFVKRMFFITLLPASLDATFADYGPDLKFRNSTKDPMIVHAWVEGNQLVVRLLGTSTGREVELSSKIERETEDYIFATSFRTVRENGEVVIRNEQIATSRYINDSDD